MELPVTTAVENGLETFFYDVSEYNNHSANFLNSAAHFLNNIIDAVKSCFKYFQYIGELMSSITDSGFFPYWLGTLFSLSLFFMILHFVRGR